MAEKRNNLSIGDKSFIAGVVVVGALMIALFSIPAAKHPKKQYLSDGGKTYSLSVPLIPLLPYVLTISDSASNSQETREIAFLDLNNPKIERVKYFYPDHTEGYAAADISHTGAYLEYTKDSTWIGRYVGAHGRNRTERMISLGRIGGLASIIHDTIIDAPDLKSTTKVLKNAKDVAKVCVPQF